MRITVDTLPLWDAFRQEAVCPFCALEGHLEENFLGFFLGESVMEPDVRIEVNKKGFCPEHFGRLYAQKTSKLGLALMTHTHLKESLAALEKEIQAIDAGTAEADSFFKRAAGSGDFNRALEHAATFAEKLPGTCVVCERKAVHMERYLETAISMWEHDADFRKLFEQTKGFCLPHWGALLKASSGAMTKKKVEFIRLLNELEKRSLEELEKDLEWFTKKFDYHNTDKPWGNSKDSLPRAINAIDGLIIKSSQ